MIPEEQVRSELEALGLGAWAGMAVAAVEERLSARTHGDFPGWQGALNALDVAGDDAERIETALKQLSPWRKGPFTLGPVFIDAEWRSNLKWQRVRSGIASLEGRRVLDVGCGNGYYSLEMLGDGAARVLGIDPTVLFVMQFLAVQRFIQRPGALILPLRLEELPLPARAFDTSFSMGVLYHRRSPIDHLKELRQTLRPGGQLVLETLYLPGGGAFARTPADRYARMRNVWLLPSLDELMIWLARTGFRQAEVIDRSVTRTEEQRRSAWMPFDSLEAALDPENPDLTIEGWPRPHRVVVTATAP
ncbi:MAG: tRNA 5-methoxyuridine(34)/uridine 5-oxyacetic acid(34) synthase CmoB [Pseudomonadota bacterium]